MSALTTGTNNTCIGINAGNKLTTGVSNIIIGTNADVDNVARQSCIIIGDSITPQANTQTCIGVSAGNSTANAVFIRHAAGTGNSAVWNGNELREDTSSRRFKKNIQTYIPDEKKDNFEKLRPVSFNAKDGYGKTSEPDPTTYVGLIAEEVHEIYPEFVVYESDGKTPKALFYDKMVSLLIYEMQKLRKEVKELKESK